MMQARDILKTENIIKIAPSDSLSSALSKLSTSHDAAFVFSDKNHFMGVINPYYCLIQSSHPGNSKVEHCLFHPPHVFATDSRERIAQLFMESKIHYLPVFGKQNDFLGIVSARRLLKTLQFEAKPQPKIQDIIQKKHQPLITISDTDSVATAIKIYKKHKISKLVVIGKDNKLHGILSYYNLIHFLIIPREKLHQGEREGNKVAFNNQQVKNFAISNVLTLSPQDSMKEALQLMIEKNIGSVVIVDSERHPLHILTKKDFLLFFTPQKSGKTLQVIARNLSAQSRQILDPFRNHLSSFINRLPDFNKARLMVKEEKNGGFFRVVLSLIPKRGSIYIIEREGMNLNELVKDVGRKLFGLNKK